MFRVSQIISTQTILYLLKNFIPALQAQALRVISNLFSFFIHLVYVVLDRNAMGNLYIVTRLTVCKLCWVYSWVSRDVIISLGVNSKSMHSYRREIVFHCMCWLCVWQQICAISWDVFTPVQHNHQYILGWPPLRLTAMYPSET